MTLPRASLWLLALLGLAGGWWAGTEPRRSAPPEASAAARRPAAIGSAEGAKLDAATPAGGWAARLSRATPAEMAALWREIDTLWPATADGPPPRRDAQRLLLATWMAGDVEAACAFVAGIPEATLIKDCGEFFARLYPSGAARVFATGRPPALASEESFREAMMKSLAGHSPEVFLAIPHDGSPAADLWLTNAPLALKKLAERDPAGALAQIDVLTKKGDILRDATVAEIMVRWQQIDPAKARAWIDQLPEGWKRKTALNAFFYGMAETDPRAALRQMTGLAGLFHRPMEGRLMSSDDAAYVLVRDARSAALERIARENPAEAVRFAQEFIRRWPGDEPSDSGSGRTPEQIEQNRLREADETAKKLNRAIARGWRETLPESPAAFVEALTHLDFSELGVGTARGVSWQLALMHDWLGEATPRQESQLLEALSRGIASPDDPRMPLVASSMQHAASYGVESVAAIASQLPPAVIAHIANRVFEGGGPSGEDARTMMEIFQPTVLSWNFVHNATQHDPLMVAAWLPKLEGVNQIEATRELAGAWAEADPEACAQWLLTEADPAARAPSAERMVHAWADHDDEAAARWVADLPLGGIRDSAANGLATALVHHDPEAAWAWSASIQDEAARSSSLAEVAKLWLDNDAAAARAFIETSKLQWSVKQEILAPAPK